jgi:hypothetical protein
LPTIPEIYALDPDTSYSPPVGLKLKEWSSERVRGGEQAFKRGRTTGLTRGKFNAAVQLGKKVCSAWEIVGKVGHEFVSGEI